MRRALELAATGPIADPNPRVGCVLVDPLTDTEIATGLHRGAGTAHAEAAALTAAGDRARGTTAYVTLEPCNHTGRTGPCAEALLTAGVRRVVHAAADPNPTARGGADTLRAGGVEVTSGVLAAAAEALNEPWAFAVTRGRPWVTWKFAATLDGRSAAADGTSQWLTGPAARADVHRLRSECGAIVVGTGTAWADNPRLTVRDASGAPVGRQPLRVVVGHRDLPADAHLLDATADTVHLRTHDPGEVLAALHDRDVRHVWLEGGPTLAAAFG
ncbi:MAG: bifunctional diaminohydroxyphosphoribosylaminopyrimidine deaminase/5-amino-6-(5-phosphoribosylamino)uracil reductase RibD, partial [Propionibacterium sp.]|nr:bifunctional diaminohydroxyphosphoribosylaminopyrimidine deaminase/5-amino-6-(5-phosphoribosylamino)uracil reductase RibD [Propionibacterium sp.]